MSHLKNERAAAETAAGTKEQRKCQRVKAVSLLIWLFNGTLVQRCALGF